MSFYKVDDCKCTRCGICVELCLPGIIELKGDNVPQVGFSNAPMCIKCGQCVIYCPTRANSLAFQDSDETALPSELAMPSAEAALNLLRTRRSVRCFKPEPVLDRDFSKIFDTVRMAPSSANTQAVRWIVSQNPEKTGEIRDLILCWLREIVPGEGNSHLGFLGRKALALAEEGKDMVLRGAPNVVIAVTPKNVMEEDGVIALTYIELAAHALGLGCCWAGLLTKAARQYRPLSEYLGIGEDEYLSGAQMIGYPVLLPSRQFPPRKMSTVTWLK